METSTAVLGGIGISIAVFVLGGGLLIAVFLPMILESQLGDDESETSDRSWILRNDPFETFFFNWSKTRKLLWEDEIDEDEILSRFQEVLEYLRKNPTYRKKLRRLARLILWDASIARALKENRIPILHPFLEGTVEWILLEIAARKGQPRLDHLTGMLHVYRNKFQDVFVS